MGVTKLVPFLVFGTGRKLQKPIFVILVSTCYNI